MKAVISNRIYLLVDNKLLNRIDKELTYEIPSNIPGKPFILKNYSVVNKNMPEGKQLLSIPSGRTDLIPENYTIQDKRVTRPEDINLLDSISLRNMQNNYLDYFDEIEDSHMLNAKPGTGKSIAFLALLAEKLKQKTLIVTHTVPLRSQWEKNILKTTGIKPGVIGSGKFNIDSPIVVGNVQSLNKKMSELKNQFGVTAVDECHHVSSPTFTNVVDTSFSRFKIGLSATLKRKDNRDILFQDYFTNNVFKPEKANTIDPEVEVYNAPFQLPPTGHWSERVSVLAASDEYKLYIRELANKYTKQGHKVLIVFDRPDWLELLSKTSNNRATAVVGNTLFKDRDTAIQKMEKGYLDELYGSSKIFSEGISIDNLSCLILAQPINNDILLDQLLGRINRTHPNKLQPIVADIKLQGYTGFNQFKNRNMFYRQEGLKVRYVS